MPFSVKSAKADELLAELREITGEGVTEAVIRALENRLKQLREPRPNITEFLHSFWAEHPQMLWKKGEPELSVTFNDWMYDEDGLPK